MTTDPTLAEMQAMFSGPADATDEQTIMQAGAAYLQAKEAADAAKRAKEQADEMEKKAREAILAALDRAGIESARIPSGHLLTKVKKKHFSVPPRADVDRRKEAFTWLRRHKMGDLIREDVHHQQLGSTLRAYEDKYKDQGKTVPSDLFKVYEETTVSVRKG